MKKILFMLALGAPLQAFAKMPPKEQGLISIVSQYAAKADSAPNDMAMAGFRHDRAVAVCDLLGGLLISNWTGTIEDIDSTGSGDGVLAVTISPQITLSTSNNNFSNALDQTAIPPGTPLFNKVSAMKVGDKVEFSGQFLQSDQDCIQEGSITTEGSMDDPNYSFRFTSVEAASQ